MAKRLTSRVLVQNDRGQFLAVLQGGRPKSVGLPGGGVEPGESTRDGAARELFEETGLVATKLVPVCVVLESRRETVVWAADAHGTVRSSHEGPVRWAWPEEFLAGDYGQFSAAVFEAAGI